MADAGLTGRKIIVDTMVGWRDTVVERSPGRTRPKSTGPRHTRRAMWPRILLLPVLPAALRFKCHMQ